MFYEINKFNQNADSDYRSNSNDSQKKQLIINCIQSTQFSKLTSY